MVHKVEKCGNGLRGKKLINIKRNGRAEYDEHN